LDPEVVAPRLASNLAKANGRRAAGGRIEGSTSLNTPARQHENRARKPEQGTEGGTQNACPNAWSIRKNRIAPRRVRLANDRTAIACFAFKNHALLALVDRMIHPEIPWLVGLMA
jgi:hypothetical protein